MKIFQSSISGLRDDNSVKNNIPTYALLTWGSNQSLDLYICQIHLGYSYLREYVPEHFENYSERCTSWCGCSVKVLGNRRSL